MLETDEKKQTGMQRGWMRFAGFWGAVWAVVLLGAIGGGGCLERQEVVLGPDGQRHVWQRLFRGVDLLEVAQSGSPAMRIYALRVRLNEPGVRLFVTPSNGAAPGDVDAMKVSTFLKRYRCQAAVNASPFAPVVDEEGVAMDVVGLSLSGGELYSPADRRYGALVIRKDGRAQIVEPGEFERNTALREAAQEAAGGFEVIVQTGRNVGRDQPVHPRTAVGVSRDGRVVYLVVIDGRQPGFSEGASTAQTADWLLRLGAWWGLNLDGGGSATLAVADAQGRARVVNSPIHKGVPGNERPVANHIGVYAPTGP